jgi:hypothetical protein
MRRAQANPTIIYGILRKHLGKAGASCTGLPFFFIAQAFSNLIVFFTHAICERHVVKEFVSKMVHGILNFLPLFLCL